MVEASKTDDELIEIMNKRETCKEIPEQHHKMNRLIMLLRLAGGEKCKYVQNPEAIREYLVSSELEIEIGQSESDPKNKLLHFEC